MFSLQKDVWTAVTNCLFLWFGIVWQKIITTTAIISEEQHLKGEIMLSKYCIVAFKSKRAPVAAFQIKEQHLEQLIKKENSCNN